MPRLLLRKDAPDCTRKWICIFNLPSNDRYDRPNIRGFGDFFPPNFGRGDTNFNNVSSANIWPALDYVQGRNVTSQCKGKALLFSSPTGLLDVTQHQSLIFDKK